MTVLNGEPGLTRHSSEDGELGRATGGTRSPAWNRNSYPHITTRSPCFRKRPGDPGHSTIDAVTTQIRRAISVDLLLSRMTGTRPPAALTPLERATLQRWARGRRVSHRQVERARILLAAARGLSNRRIAKEVGVSPLTVARWRSRFALLGLAGIRHDAPRIGSRRGLPESIEREIVRRTLEGRSPEGRTWSSRPLARAIGVSHTTVLRTWRAHRLGPRETTLRSLTRDSRYRTGVFEFLGVYVGSDRKALVVGELSGRRTPRTVRTSPRSRAMYGESDRAIAQTSRPLELSRLLGQLESPPESVPTRRLSRVEFLAFLDSVTFDRSRGERIHVISSRLDPSLPSTLRTWGKHRSIDFAHPAEAASLRDQWSVWLEERHPGERTELFLPELSRLRQAVDRWRSNPDYRGRPFVWISHSPTSAP